MTLDEEIKKLKETIRLNKYYLTEDSEAVKEATQVVEWLEELQNCRNVYNKALDDVIKESSSLECCGYVECKFEDIKDKIEKLRKR